MKEIKTTRQFDKDLKKVGLISPLIDILSCLIHSKPLAEKYRDHQLKGKLSQYRECHVKPDLLLIYESLEDSIKLMALDSHSNLFKD